jgi:uncharacterized protein YjhX (UPF0386 family)
MGHCRVAYGTRDPWTVRRAALTHIKKLGGRSLRNREDLVLRQSLRVHPFKLRGSLVIGFVLMVPVSAGPSQVTYLSDQLVHRGVDVIVAEGPDAAAYSMERLDAGAVVLTIGPGIPESWEVPHAFREDARVGRLFAVLTEHVLKPAQLAQLEVPAFDISERSSGAPASLGRLVEQLLQVAARRAHDPYAPTLDDGSWIIQQATQSVSELSELASSIGQLAEVLVDDAEHTFQLRRALVEVRRTYLVTKSSIECFVAAGLRPGGIDLEAFARLERGTLRSAIESGRGHCGRITTLYRRVGGLRSAVAQKASSDLIAAMDQSFSRLGTADGDLFHSMDELGAALTGHARLVVTLLASGRPDEAERAVVRARQVLLPLEDRLDDALAAFQLIEASLGHAEPTEIETGANVTIQNISVGGDMIGVNAVAAHMIENSSFIVQSATTMSDELKATLTELHKAVAQLTATLPDDDAELVAHDLEDLTKEATAAKPRPKFWRRAADNLLAAAKTVSDVGVPIIDLVTRVVTLIG